MNRAITTRRALNWRRWYVAVFGALLCGAVAAAPTQAGVPADQMRGVIEKVLAVLKDPNLKSPAKKTERLEQLRQIIYSKFDFAEMAKRSLGAQWQRRTPEEQREFVKLFTELLENAYFDNIESYDGEKVMISGEKQDQDFAEVNSKITTKKGEEIAINYKLQQAGGDWKVYDVVIENISLVNNYRSQFNRVIAQSSFEDLLRRMRDKQLQTADKKQKT
ncbi:MAG: MlaC/ttg2D family ABC transporter substrate-binding protein [Candidatus Binatia bacterium]